MSNATALDYLVAQYPLARRELNDLRLAASEADALRAKLSELYAVINRDGGHSEQEDPDVFAHTIKRVAVLIRENEAQARQIEAARVIMENFCGVSSRDMRTLIDAWLAANAPEPAPEAEGVTK